jgi:hypothetical protein
MPYKPVCKLFLEEIDVQVNLQTEDYSAVGFAMQRLQGAVDITL